MFKDRIDAAKKLINILPDVKFDIVAGIPKGGVVISKEISRELNIPHSIIMAKKISSPYNKEVAIGGVCIDGSFYLNYSLINEFKIKETYINEEIRKTIKGLQEEYSLRSIAVPENKSVLLVDDGIATGYTALGAIEFLKKYNNNVYLASPVVFKNAYDLLKDKCSKVYAVIVSDFQIGISQYYEEFNDINRNEVNDLFNQYNYKRNV